MRMLAALAALLLFASGAHAASLQISPVSITLRAGQNAAGITLQNTGSAPIFGQVRVFSWDQDKTQDVLVPTAELLASPPIVRIAAGATQTVRLVLAAPVAGAGERTYRVLIDELAREQSGAEAPRAPGSAAGAVQPAPATGIDIRLRYSVPVFVNAAQPGNAVLAWHTWRHDGHWMLRVTNSGARHAQIGTLDLTNRAGVKFAVSAGLFGYVLPGRTREWRLPLAPGSDLAGSLTVHALVNARPLVATSAPAN